ncbi:hypothetical protein ACL9RF_03490 [Sphingobacterium sp. Mn56C]|uniref:hypothetical protein n=1 Tax=Sphingobacterium sp. Mn56C TaxID=3395261 RepID=UPI003BC70B85
MKKTKLKTAFLGILAALTLGLFAVGCSKSDDNNGPNLEKNLYKITVALSDVDVSRDFVSIAVAGGTATGKTDVWKVNGTPRAGESAIGLNKNDFGAGTKTYVIESTEPIAAFSGSVQIINYGAGLPISLKIEKGDKVVVNENITLTGDGSDFTKSYSF